MHTLESAWSYHTAESQHFKQDAPKLRTEKHFYLAGREGNLEISVKSIEESGMEAGSPV